MLASCKAINETVVESVVLFLSFSFLKQRLWLIDVLINNHKKNKHPPLDTTLPNPFLQVLSAGR